MSLVLTAFIGATLPFFARRFGKFLPADAGTALARLWHRPKFSPTKKENRHHLRLRLWGTLIFASLFWAVFLCGAHLFLKQNGLPLFYLILFYEGALLSMVDEKIYMLPDVLTVPLLLFGFAGSAFNITLIPPSLSAFGALAGFVMPTVASFVMTPFRPRGIGGGDFKTLAAIGSWLGFIGLSVSIFLSFFYFVLIALIKRKKEGPYGLSLFLSVLTTFVLQIFYGTDLFFFVG